MSNLDLWPFSGYEFNLSVCGMEGAVPFLDGWCAVGERIPILSDVWNQCVLGPAKHGYTALPSLRKKMEEKDFRPLVSWDDILSWNPEASSQSQECYMRKVQCNPCLLQHASCHLHA